MSGSGIWRSRRCVGVCYRVSAAGCHHCALRRPPRHTLREILGHQYVCHQLCTGASADDLTCHASRKKILHPQVGRRFGTVMMTASPHESVQRAQLRVQRAQKSCYHLATSAASGHATSRVTAQGPFIGVSVAVNPASHHATHARLRRPLLAARTPARVALAPARAGTGRSSARKRLARWASQH